MTLKLLWKKRNVGISKRWHSFGFWPIAYTQLKSNTRITTLCANAVRLNKLPGVSISLLVKLLAFALTIPILQPAVPISISGSTCNSNCGTNLPNLYAFPWSVRSDPSKNMPCARLREFAVEHPSVLVTTRNAIEFDRLVVHCGGWFLIILSVLDSHKNLGDLWQFSTSVWPKWYLTFVFLSSVRDSLPIGICWLNIQWILNVNVFKIKRILQSAWLEDTNCFHIYVFFLKKWNKYIYVIIRSYLSQILLQIVSTKPSPNRKIRVKIKYNNVCDMETFSSPKGKKCGFISWIKKIIKNRKYENEKCLNFFSVFLCI